MFDEETAGRRQRLYQLMEANRSHKKGSRTRPNRRRRDSDPESGGRRHTEKREERHRSKPSDSPPSSCPRVVLLRPAASGPAPGSASPSRSQSPLSQPLGDEPAESPVSPVRRKERVPDAPVRKDPDTCIKLIDPLTWCLNESLAAEYMIPDGPLSACFKVVSVVGTQSCGKSQVMNALAGCNVFRCHGNDTDSNLLQHVTKGIDMWITPERMFLLDSQPLLSASILDDFINSSIPVQSIFPADLSEADLLYITSLHVVSFLLSVSDCLIVANDWLLDPHLVKLIATAIAMIGTTPHQLNIIWFHDRELSKPEAKELDQSLSSLFGRGSVSLIHGDSDELVRSVMRLNTGRENLLYPAAVTEKSWLLSAQRFWDNLVKKPMYNEFIRLR